MSKQTAITKAIQQLRKDICYHDDINTRMAGEYAIQILTELLPYERETIEAAYQLGDLDAKYENSGDVGDRLYISETDYFTKTYNQND